MKLPGKKKKRDAEKSGKATPQESEAAEDNSGGENAGETADIVVADGEEAPRVRRERVPFLTAMKEGGQMPLDVMLGAAVIQLVLALLLYIFASLNLFVLLTLLSICAFLILLHPFSWKEDNKTVVVIFGIVYILVLPFALNASWNAFVEETAADSFPVVTFVAIVTGVVFTWLLYLSGKSERTARRISRAANITALILPVAIMIAVIIVYMAVVIPQSQAAGYADDAENSFLYVFTMLTSFILLPCFVFFQPALVINTMSLKKIDIYLARIGGIAIFVISVCVCAVAMEYKLYGDELMIYREISLVEWTFLPEMFRTTIMIDNILTRIALCLCSAAFTVSAFMLKPKSAAEKRMKKAAKRKSA